MEVRFPTFKEAKGFWTNPDSITFEVNQSDFFLQTLEQVSGRLPIGAENTMLCSVELNSSKADWKQNIC